MTYYPYVEPERGAGRGLLRALGEHAAVCVTDDFPAFGLPGMVAAAARQVPVRLEAVDSNGLVPLRAADRAFPTAYGFRRFLQRHLPGNLGERPQPAPLSRRRLPALGALPPGLTRRWPPTPVPRLAGDVAWLAALPIDHAVGAVSVRGGATAARAALRRFLADRLPRYVEERNEPDADGTSGLSPYLHFGHISPHEIVAALTRREDWSPRELAGRATGNRQGWWGLSAPAEAFLDQLVT